MQFVNAFGMNLRLDKMTKLFAQIEQLVPTLHGWASVDKCQKLAASVITLQPQTSVIIGVWGGRDTFALALAHKFIGKGRVLAIDPWVEVASVQGQTTDADRMWWSKIPHESVYLHFLEQRKSLGLEELITVQRMISDYAEPPKSIDGILVIDGNHGPNAVHDVQRFAPSVEIGGIVLMDDVNWSGGFVQQGITMLKLMGFRSLYTVDTSEVFMRVSG